MLRVELHCSDGALGVVAVRSHALVRATVTLRLDRNVRDTTLRMRVKDVHIQVPRVVMSGVRPRSQPWKSPLATLLRAMLPTAVRRFTVECRIRDSVWPGGAERVPVAVRMARHGLEIGVRPTNPKMGDRATELDEPRIATLLVALITEAAHAAVNRTARSALGTSNMRAYIVRAADGWLREQSPVSDSNALGAAVALRAPDADLFDLGENLIG